MIRIGSVYMAVSLIQDSNVLKAFLSGEIDHHSAADMRLEIDEWIRRDKPKILVLDFSEVTFMDSSGIGLIMGRYKLMGILGGSVRVVNVSDRIDRILRLSGVSAIATIERKDEAV